MIQSQSSSPSTWQRLEFAKNKSVLMLGTDPRTRGGIAAVIETLLLGGLSERVPVTFIPTHTDGTRTAKVLRFIRALGEVCAHLALRRAVLVHAHVSSNASFWRKSLLLLFARRFGVPTIFHLHSGGFAKWSTQGGSRFAFRRWWVRHTLEASDTVILLTRHWESWVNDYAPKSHTIVIGNPVRVPARLPPVDARGSSHGSGRVLFLGWIYDFKGVYDLLHAWVVFREHCYGWRLVIGGKGEVDKLLATAEQLGIREDVDFLGWITGKDKERELRTADIFVLPSYVEGMPVSLLEAMAFGVPVICTPVGGVPDMLTENDHAAWVQPGDIAGLAKCMCEFADSPDLRQRLASSAYEHVSHSYSVEVSITSLVELYNKLKLI